jgi:hypothetical protein
MTTLVFKLHSFDEKKLKNVSVIAGQGLCLRNAPNHTLKNTQEVKEKAHTALASAARSFLLFVAWAQSPSSENSDNEIRNSSTFRINYAL